MCITAASVAIPVDSHTTPSPSGMNCTRDIYINDTSSAGTISSPNFGVGLQYPPNSRCVWRFFAPFGYAIHLAFSQFGVEGGRSCPFDSVTAFDGQYSTGRMIAKYCGNTVPAPIDSKTNSMFVSFVSDGSTQDMGFRATYTIQKVSGKSTVLHSITKRIEVIGCFARIWTVLSRRYYYVLATFKQAFSCFCSVSTQTVLTDQACHGSTPLILNETTGFIYSERFTLGLNYPDNLNCRWHIKAPADKVISLQFNVRKSERCNVANKLL